MAFVKMDSALRENDFCLLDFAKNESADVTGNSWLRDFGKLGVGNNLFLLWIDNERVQTGAEDDGDLGVVIAESVNCLCHVEQQRDVASNLQRRSRPSISLP